MKNFQSTNFCREKIQMHTKSDRIIIYNKIRNRPQKLIDQNPKHVKLLVFCGVFIVTLQKKVYSFIILWSVVCRFEMYIDIIRKILQETNGNFIVHCTLPKIVLFFVLFSFLFLLSLSFRLYCVDINGFFLAVQDFPSYFCYLQKNTMQT